MVNFENARIYKITNIKNGKIYLGSTTDKYLSNRMAKHRARKDSRLQREIGNIYDCKIELIENVETDNRIELRQREREYIEGALKCPLCNCVNKNIPNRSQKEYMIYYNEKLKQQRKLKKLEKLKNKNNLLL